MADRGASFGAVERRGKRSLDTEPRARRARYDRKTGRVVVELTNGCSFAFPARRAQGLERASENDLAEVSILGLGLGLHWERLDVDLSVPGCSPGSSGPRRTWIGSAQPARARRHRLRRRQPRGAMARKADGRGRAQRRARRDEGASGAL